MTPRDDPAGRSIPSDAANSARNPAQARFLATMSHELRTPLNVVIGYSDAMKAEPDMPGEQIVEYAAAINDAGRQLLTLVDVILDVARVEAGQLDLPGDLIDVHHLIRTSTAQLASLANAGQITLMSDVGEGLPLLRGDERRLRQAMRHLVANAVKFTGGGGAVRVSARLDPVHADLLVLVSDTGIGIAAHDMDRVFEPFLQLDGSFDRRFPGSGLGLYVSRITAQAHGGDLMLRSKVGVGTTAILRLPNHRLVAPPAQLSKDTV